MKRDKMELYSFKSAVNTYEMMEGLEPTLWEIEVNKRKLM